MSDQMLVSTRKGLFVLERSNGAWGIARTSFLGHNIVLALHDPRDGSWYAALDLGHFGAKLQRSTDHGRNWNECAVPAFEATDTVVTGDGKPPQPATLRLIWSLEPGAS